ncbi:hypothetical protein L3Y34_013245 [Caenorhabditis briggsae]|uniref:Uncharacterized protein n=1 Tax=Caenorhabditis briggsae TaxID=6238 RepID=A0AAE8ZUF8_CAEBR|nr:hypothetical protein L3Y34_013245 [Caenorhabditis briggsae]
MSQTLPQSTAEFSELYSAFVKKELSFSKKGSNVRKEIVQQTIEGRLAAFLVIRKCRKRAAAINAKKATDNMEEKTTKRPTKCCVVISCRCSIIHCSLDDIHDSGPMRHVKY